MMQLRFQYREVFSNIILPINFLPIFKISNWCGNNLPHFIPPFSYSMYTLLPRKFPFATLVNVYTTRTAKGFGLSLYPAKPGISLENPLLHWLEVESVWKSLGSCVLLHWLITLSHLFHWPKTKIWGWLANWVYSMDTINVCSAHRTPFLLTGNVLSHCIISKNSFPIYLLYSWVFFSIWRTQEWRWLHISVCTEVVALCIPIFPLAVWLTASYLSFYEL